MKLRRFTAEGIREFRELLAACRRQPETEIPFSLIENKSLTEVVSPAINIAPGHFETKGDAARYLESILSPVKDEELTKDAGLWSWLSLLYFDSVCPFEDGKPLIKNDYMYIFEPTHSRHFYRNLLFTSWQILKLAPNHNRLFLTSRLNFLDQVTERVMSRLFLIRIPCIFEVLDRLYWDEKNGRSRRGITGMKIVPGDLRHRLPARIRQLEMTYDLISLSADQLIGLLGDEFAFARVRVPRLFQIDQTAQIQ